MKCTFVYAILQSVVIGWVQGLILDMCEPADCLNIYIQKMYSSLCFLCEIYVRLM